MTHTEDLIHRLRDTASRGVSSWGDLQQEAADEIERLAQPVPHREGYWCVNLNCSKCYGAEFRFKHTTPPLPVQEPSTVKDYLTNETGPVQSDLLTRCETEMRYAGWINAEADNPQRQELYIAVCKALKEKNT